MLEPIGEGGEKEVPPGARLESDVGKGCSGQPFHCLH